MNGPLPICPTGAVASPSGRSGIDMTAKRKGLSRIEVITWLEASCAEQGVPLHVEDRTALRQVGILLGMGTDGLDRAEAVSTTSAKAERAHRPARQDRGRAS
jgi:hypothetical protein